MASNKEHNPWENFERRQQELFQKQQPFSAANGIPRAQPAVRASSRNQAGDNGGYDNSGYVGGQTDGNWRLAGRHEPTDNKYPYPGGGPSRARVAHSDYGSPSPREVTPEPFSYAKAKKLEGHNLDAYPYPDQFRDQPSQPMYLPETEPQHQIDQNRNTGSKDHGDEVFEGLRKKRKCRDLICLGIFAGLCAFMAGMLIYGAVESASFGELGDALDGCVKDEWNGNAGKGWTYRGGFKAISLTFIGRRLSHHGNLTRDTAPRAVCYGGDTVEDFADDLDQWPKVLYTSLIAVGLSLILTILLRFFAGVIIWLTYILMWIVTIGGIAGAWVAYTQINGGGDTYLLVIAIIVSVVLGLFLIVLFFMRKDITLVIKIFQEASKAVIAVPFVFLQPIWTLLAHLVSTGLFFVVLALLLLTMPENYRQNGKCMLNTLGIVGVSLNVVSLLWMWQFICGCQHFIVSGAVSRWFFTRDKSNLGVPILSAWKQLVVYNLGSVAVGSFIIALVKFLRWLANFARRAVGSSNPLLKIIGCLIACFVTCIEQLIGFLCRNAYIEMAIYGYGFFPAAKRAAKVIASNVFKIAAINSVGDFVLFLSKLVVAIGSAGCGYLMYNDTCTDEMRYVWTAVSAIFAYIVAHCFMSIYEMTIDTIFICFCEDCDKNDGVNKPYFMSTNLMKFVEESAGRKEDKKKSKKDKADKKAAKNKQ